MNHDNHLTDDLAPLMPEAIEWVLRLTSGAATQDDAHAFEQWRAQGPDHAAAFREAAAFRKAVRGMDLPPPVSANNHVLPIARRPDPTLINRRSLLVGGGALAASTAAYLVAQPPLGLWPSYAELAAEHRTGLGERKRLVFAESATIEMNARSALSALADNQGVHLITGEAFVAVDGAPAEFVVEAGGERLSSQSAQFNIRTSRRETCVTCLSGLLQRHRNGQRLPLRPGEQLVALPDGQSRIERVDPMRASGWRRGLLIFRDTPLAEALEDINRYRSGRIVLANDALAARPINGVFHTDQIENAVLQIQQLLGAEVTRLPGGVIWMT